MLSKNNNESPIAVIQRLSEERADWSDDEVLNELTQLPPLPDESVFHSMEDWSELYLFLALADICSERKLRHSVKLILDRVSYGDVGETMRGIRHNLESVVNPDWDFLAEECISALSSERPGTRFWAIEELSILKLKRTIPALENCLNDSEETVRESAREAIETILEWGE